MAHKAFDKDIHLAGNKRVNVYVGDGTTPSPLAVTFYVGDNYDHGPDSDLPDALTEALQQLLESEAATKGNASVFGTDGTAVIPVASLPGHGPVQVVAQQGLQFTVEVQQFVMVACPGMPGWYSAPAWYRTTALALALVETVKRQAAGEPLQK